MTAILTEAESVALRKIEDAVRDFITYFDKYPSRLFAPKTNELVAQIRPELDRLNELRGATAQDESDSWLPPAA